MSPSTRRRALRLLGATAAAGLAGCAGVGAPTTSSPEASPSPSPTDATAVLDPGEPYEAADGTTVTVRGVRVERLVRSTSVGSPTHVDVAWLADHQFAVVEVEVAGDGGSSPGGSVARADVPSDRRLALDVDGTRHPRADRHHYRAVPPGTHERPGLPAVPVPVRRADAASVVWVRGDARPVRWTVPPATVDRLGVAPSFAVRSLDVPDSVRRGLPVDASFVVANAGGRAGRFVAEFGVGAISDHGEVATTVPAGGERTYSARLDPYAVGDVDETTVTLDWGRERLERRVTVTD